MQNKKGSFKGWMLLPAMALLLLLLWMCLPGLRRALSGLVMLFTQRSVQSLQGYMQNAASPQAAALLLSAFHAFAMFYLPPRQIVAAAAVLGPVQGAALSLAGSLLGGCIWYALLRFAPGRAGEGAAWRKALGENCAGLCAGGIWLLGGMCAPLLGLCGVLRLAPGRCLLGAAMAEAAHAILYAFLCSPYSALLPAGIQTALRLLGLCVLFGCGWRIYRALRAK